MNIVPYPRTENFEVLKEAGRDSKSTILTIYYKGGQHFGHTWPIPKSFGEEFGAGKWTFNRGKVAIDNDYFPPVYNHDTLIDLLYHLEETFSETGVPYTEAQSEIDGSSEFVARE